MNKLKYLILIRLYQNFGAIIFRVGPWGGFIFGEGAELRKSLFFLHVAPALLFTTERSMYEYVLAV